MHHKLVGIIAPIINVDRFVLLSAKKRYANLEIWSLLFHETLSVDAPTKYQQVFEPLKLEMLENGTDETGPTLKEDNRTRRRR